MTTDIDPVVAAFDLSEFLTLHGLSFTHSSGEYVLECPCCFSKKLYIGISNKLFICFKCNERGNLYRFISLITNEDPRAIFKRLHGLVRTYINISEPIKLNIGGTKTNLVTDASSPVFLPDVVPLDSLADTSLAQIYVNQRGLTRSMIQKFDLCYSHGWKRLIFPIFLDASKELHGWIGRDVTGLHQQKYLNNIGLRKHKFLYGQHLHKDNESVVLVEGPIDAIKCHAHGGLAMMGKSLSTKQLGVLLEMPKLKRIIVGLDYDAAKDSHQIINLLSTFWQTYFVQYGNDFRDFGARNEKEVDDLVSGAVLYDRNLSPIKLSVGDIS